MKFDHYTPCKQLQPYIKHLVVSENALANEYKVLPSTGLVIGFQYKGQLAAIDAGKPHKLATAGITGIADSYKVFRNSANIGTILVFFTELGFSHFTSQPAHELFNLSLSLDLIFKKNQVDEVEEKLSAAVTDSQRLKVVELFLLSQMKHIPSDKLITEAVRLIYQHRGTIRISDLNKILFISQSPFEKRFRKTVGTTPKKFASIVRLHTILNDLTPNRSLTDISYEYNFFDQAHFTRPFKQFTDQTPESFQRAM